MFEGLTRWCDWAEINQGSGKIVMLEKENPKLRKHGSITSWKIIVTFMYLSDFLTQKVQTVIHLDYYMVTIIFLNLCCISKPKSG